ncbi:PREDICTED: transmembrane protein 62-like [Nicrophorus vespilloides]|uniref:Transmembrane protein 62-like n=1 Tax=Nicrophorus vespilloides TaxID=110193 RepID=A0ABM1MC89_NICVS|nr:PREDICTED: transmembrane protein 62-like [Nicrophorus vespilloides]
MRNTKSTLFVITLTVIFFMLISNVTNILTHKDSYTVADQTREKQFSPRRALPQITDSNDNLIWFLQISDIHISMFREKSRVTEFSEFCQITLDVIKPTVVLATGDLTDATDSDNIGSHQNKGDWEFYKQVLKEANVLNKTIWLDIRGNHDTFNVISLESPQNFFTNYSIQGKENPRSYLYQIEKNGILYSFLGVDACLKSGPRRPFNFVGLLYNQEIDEIKLLIEKVKESKSEHTIWFGHFPTSCVLSQSDGIRSLLGSLKQGTVYVCGHLHTLVSNMYTLQNDGFLELELGDWKNNRRYRLMAIDHGFISFTDVGHREWPVVLITNPKDALFVIPEKENLESIANSTHIRVLVFSVSKITEVQVNIDETGWLTCIHKNGPLYVLEWDPSIYGRGLHHIKVFVKDESNREKIISQPFSLDGARPSFKLLSRIALMGNFSLIFQGAFYVFLVLLVLPVISYRFIHKLVIQGKLRKPVMRKGFFRTWIRKMWILSSIDRLFWPIVLYPIYLSFGPWSIGYIIEDYIGVVFPWGIFVNGSFLPGSFTYVYGTLHLLILQLQVFNLANAVDSRFRYHIVKADLKKSFWGNMKLTLPFAMLMILQIILAYLFWLIYGTVTFLLGPLNTWSVIFTGVLWHLALTLPVKCIREATLVWQVESGMLHQTDDIVN